MKCRVRFGNSNIDRSTKSLYYFLFQKVPINSINEKNLKTLMSLIKEAPEKDHLRLIRYYGFECSSSTLEALAMEEGFKSPEPILRSLDKCQRFLCGNYRRAIQLLFTPHFEVFRECTELGNCPWRLNCRVDIINLALNPQKILEVDDLALCETLKAWKTSIPPTVFKSPVND